MVLMKMHSRTGYIRGTGSRRDAMTSQRLHSHMEINGSTAAGGTVLTP